MKKTCNYKTNDTNTDIDKEIATMKPFELINAPFSKVIETFMFSFINVKLLFKKCWWNENEIDCNKLVLTTFNERGFSFIINWNTDLAQNFLQNNTGEKLLYNVAYITYNT